MSFTAQDRVDLIKLYVSAFDRAPDFDGLEFWSNALKDGALDTVVDVANDMFTLEEVKAIYPDALTNMDFVSLIYQNVLGRQADQEGLEFWTAAMNEGGLSRGELVVSMFDAISSYNGTDPEGLFSQQLFANKVEASERFVDELESDNVQASKNLISDSRLNDDANTIDSTLILAREELGARTADDDSLSQGLDILIGSEEIDQFTALSGTIDTGDYVDGAQSGTDTINVTYQMSDISANQKPTIVNVERININIDSFDGTSSTFNAKNVSDSFISLSSQKLGYDGKAGVVNAGDNDIEAGNNVEDLTVTGLTTGLVSGGSASDVSISTELANDVARFSASQDVNLDVATATRLAIVGDDVPGHIISLDSLSVEQVAMGSTEGGSLTLSAKAAVLDGVSVIGADKVLLTDGLSADLSNIDSETPISLANFTNTGVSSMVQLANNADVSLADAMTDLHLVGNGSFAVLSVDVEMSQQSLSIGQAGEVNFTFVNNQESSVSFEQMTLNANEASFELSSDDLVINQLSTDGAIVVTSDQGSSLKVLDANSVIDLDLSGLNGTFSGVFSQSAEVFGSTGRSEVVFSSGDNVFTGQNDNDFIDASMVSLGSVASDMGQGNDEVRISDATLSSIIAIDFGDNEDTLYLENGTDFTNADRLTLVELERIEVDDVDGASVMLTTSFLNGKTINVFQETLVNSASVDIVVDTDEIDLAGITFTNIDNVSYSTPNSGSTVNGSEGDDIINGGEGSDSINGAGGDDVLNGGDGDDQISGGAGNDSIAGDDGDDMISGDDGDDSLSGNAGDDIVSGGAGNDSISGGAGSNVLIGGDGDDVITLESEANSEAVAGLLGSDSIIIESDSVEALDEIHFRSFDNQDVISGIRLDQTITGSQTDSNHDFIAFLDNGVTGEGSVDFDSSDVITGSFGSRFESGSTDYIETDTITSFNSLDGVANKVIKIDSGAANETVNALQNSSVTNSYVVFESVLTESGGLLGLETITTREVSVYYDSDWSDSSGRVEIAKLVGVNIDDIDATDFGVYSTNFNGLEIA